MSLSINVITFCQNCVWMDGFTQGKTHVATSRTFADTSYHVWCDMKSKLCLVKGIKSVGAGALLMSCSSQLRA